MPRFSTGILLTQLLLLVLSSASCGGKGGNDEPPEFGSWELWETLYLPYIEEVNLPKEIYAGEITFFTMRLSAAAQPLILHGVNSRISSVISVRGVSVEPWFMEMGTADEPLREVQTYDLPPLPEGQQTIRILSVRDRAMGGAVTAWVDMNAYPGGSWDSLPDAEYREYTIHVLPPRSASP